MKEININQILYEGFKKFEGKIIKAELFNNYWLIKEVYLGNDGNAKIKFFIWNLLQKKWVYNSTNIIKDLNPDWKPVIINKKDFNRLIILDKLR